MSEYVETNTGILIPQNVGKLSVDQLPQANYGGKPVNYSYLDGDKFEGGFGVTQIYEPDYWLLRQRSSQLFEDNLYARGLFRRMITNIINTGLTLEAMPDPEITGLGDDGAEDWSELVEKHFELWGKSPICDYKGVHNFAELQKILKLEAYIQGDMLVVLKHHAASGMPQVHIIDGNDVMTPVGASLNDKIEDGVEFDGEGRVIAFHVAQDDGSSKRILAKGSRSGMEQAFLVYGTEKRYGRVRGVPLLALILQSLKELDRYRASETRAAVINAMLAMVVEKEENVLGSAPMANMAASMDDLLKKTDQTTDTRELRAASFLPGMIIDELAVGEKIKSHDTSRPNINYAAFEQAMLSAIAWANEIPPEILLQGFNSNYVAAMGSISEFKLFLNKERSAFAAQFNVKVYKRALFNFVQRGLVRADGFIESFNNPAQYYVYEAWVLSDWSGAIKPHVDLLKITKGYAALVAEGSITRDRMTRELTGMKFSRVVRKLMKENEMLKEVRDALGEIEKLDASTDNDNEGLEDGENSTNND